MSIFGNLFCQSKKAASQALSGAQPKFIRKDRNSGGTYEIYRGKDAESAKQFLARKKVDEQLYYIVVETPEGNWGIDVKGLYLERLLPFQSNLAAASCDGSTCGVPDIFSLQMAARGFNDNFIAKVVCGNCRHEWLDGLRYHKLTVVKCPNCKTFNQIDSSNFNVYFT